jgi:hypothetical protein
MVKQRARPIIQKREMQMDNPEKKVLFLRDIPWDDDDEKEIEFAKSVLQDEGINPVFIGPEARETWVPIPPDFLDQVTPDIVLIDYGGMAIMGAHDGALSNVRYILEWAEDHPSAAIIVWTQFTQFLADEIYEDFGKNAPANVFIYRAGHDEIWDAIRLYLGIANQKA